MGEVFCFWDCLYLLKFIKAVRMISFWVAWSLYILILKRNIHIIIIYLYIISFLFDIINILPVTCKEKPGEIGQHDKILPPPIMISKRLARTVFTSSKVGNAFATLIFCSQASPVIHDTSWFCHFLIHRKIRMYLGTFWKSEEWSDNSLGVGSLWLVILFRKLIISQTVKIYMYRRSTVS